MIQRLGGGNRRGWFELGGSLGTWRVTVFHRRCFSDNNKKIQTTIFSFHCQVSPEFFRTSTYLLPSPTTPRWSLFHNRLVLWMLWIDYSFIPLYWRERVMHSGFFLIVAHFPELIVIMSGFIKWSHFSVPIQHRHRKWAWSIRQFFSPHPKQHNRRNHNNK